MQTLKCGNMTGTENCLAPVTHIDEQGFVYCESCGNTRKQYRRCRKLAPRELRQLESGKPLSSYSNARRSYLIREAKDTIRFRGHVMRRFVHDPLGATYICPCCGAGIAVIDRPQANQSELMGEALAVECVGSRLAMYQGGAA